MKVRVAGSLLRWVRAPSLLKSHSLVLKDGWLTNSLEALVAVAFTVFLAVSLASCSPGIPNAVRVTVRVAYPVQVGPSPLHGTTGALPTNESSTPLTRLPNALVDEISKLELLVTGGNHSQTVQLQKDPSRTYEIVLPGPGSYLFEVKGYGASGSLILYGQTQRNITSATGNVIIATNFTANGLLRVELDLSNDLLSYYEYREATATFESLTKPSLVASMRMQNSKLTVEQQLAPGVWKVRVSANFLSKITGALRTLTFDDYIEVLPLKTHQLTGLLGVNLLNSMVNVRFPAGYVLGFDEIHCRLSRNGQTVMSQTFRTQNFQISVPESASYTLNLEARKNGSTVFCYTGTHQINGGEAFDILLREGRFGKIVAFDTSTKKITFESIGTFDVSSSVKVNGTTPSSFGSVLYPGQTDVLVKFDQNSAITEINFTESFPRRIRVRVSSNIGSQGNLVSSIFSTVTLELVGTYTITVQDSSAVRNLHSGTFSNNKLSFSINNEAILVRLDGNVLGSFDLRSRFYVKALSETSKLKILERVQANGKNNFYLGDFEVIYVPSSGSQGFRVINDVPLETYLYYVLPSEMDSSFHTGALQAQAIVARTYAVRKILYDKRLASFGANVDDTINYQVYNREETGTIFQQAVDSTNGRIILYNNSVADVYFYANSGGLAFNGADIFNLNHPYLTHKHLSLGTDYLPSPQDEAQISEFIKNWNRDFLRSKGYFEFTNSMTRWKVEFPPEKVVQNANLAQYRTIVNPYTSLEPNVEDELQINPFNDNNQVWHAPNSTTEQLVDVRVTRRGRGGDVQEFQIITTSGPKTFSKNKLSTVFKLDSQTPVQISNGTTRTDFGYLLSDFVTFEVVRDSSGRVSKVVVWGGGFGHCVGMSQVGAHCLCKYHNYTPEQVVLYFFPGCSVSKVY